jgi:hypothetical protein
MDIRHNDISGVLHMPYDEMLAHLPQIIVEIKKAIEVKSLTNTYITSTSDDLKNVENTVCK